MWDEFKHMINFVRLGRQFRHRQKRWLTHAKKLHNCFFRDCYVIPRIYNSSLIDFAVRKFGVNPDERRIFLGRSWMSEPFISGCTWHAPWAFFFLITRRPECEGWLAMIQRPRNFWYDDFVPEHEQRGEESLRPLYNISSRKLIIFVLLEAADCRLEWPAQLEFAIFFLLFLSLLMFRAKKKIFRWSLAYDQT